MNLPKTATFGALTLAVTLSLTACTGGDPDPVAQSKNISISVASGTSATELTLGTIYAEALRSAGYQVTESESSANPYQQVLDGHADLAISTADHTTVEGFKTADPAVRALQQSDAQSTPVLVMSAAEATSHGVDSVPSLAANCQKLEIIGVAPQTESLSSALDAEGCTKPRYKTVPAAQLANQLRASLNRVVILDSADAIIGDEGFEIIAGSEKIFEAKTVVPLAEDQLDQEAQNLINSVTKKIDQTSLIGINRMVSGVDALDPQTAAGRFKILTQ
ncbi:glycine betaine ABC transporter substrate-binding protein [Glutamicibacter ardleyensis]|uniref:glycine betaine ABC transporter substrate-binding protein n=1 Tax=Glutamicibacter ardleyensis TaxID=225894 RepID=UPI003FD01893